MRVLVVGAGAVGRVLALHLLRAGAHVTFGVRRPESVRPTLVVELRRLRPPRTFPLPKLEAVSALDGLPPFDLVFLAVPSDALDGEFLRSVAPRFAPATVVAFQPGLEDRRRLLALGLDEGTLVRGLVGLVAFDAPRPGGAPAAPEGTTFWLPPLSPWAFDGPRARVQPVVALLRRGGLPAVQRPGLERELVFFTAALLVMVRAIERHGWSLQSLASDPVLAARAAGEALAVVERQLGTRPPAGPALVGRPALVSLGARLGPAVVPFDLEAYLRAHFTKVAPQTQLLLGDLVRDGQRLGVPVPTLRALLDENHL